MKAEIWNENGVSGVAIHGVRHSFAATRSFRPEGEIVRSFSEHGVHFYNIFPSGIMTALLNRTVPYSKFGPVWIGENQYNWENLRRQCDEIIGNISEEDYVSISVHLDPPEWFIRKYPEHMDHWEQMMQNIGSEKWKYAATDYLCKLIDKMDEWYPNRVYAVFLLCGGTTEWYSYHADEVIDHPTELQRKAFRKYMKNETAEIPSPGVLLAATEGVLRHPEKDKAAMDYWRFTNDVVADAILHFAHAAKIHTGGTKLVGLFNGHIYGLQLDLAVRTSYNAIDRLLDSEDIDMIFCPASYISRKLSSTSGIRTPVDSIRNAGKLFVHEIDSATGLQKNKESQDSKAAQSHAGRDEAFSCTDETKMYMRRETGIVLAKGQGYWWFDMFSGCYEDPTLLDEISKLKALQDCLAGRDNSSISEVVEILDISSNYVLKTDSHYPMTEHQTEILNASGAPWDMCLDRDLRQDGFEYRYKLYIFPSLFAPDAEMCRKIESIRKAGNSILYMHAPGYVTEYGFSEESMLDLTGIRLRKVTLSDNTVCGVGTLEGESYAFTTHDAFGEVTVKTKRKHEPSFVYPVFTAENLDVVLGVFRENGLPACGIKFRKDGAIDAFSACAPVPEAFIREIYRFAKVFSYVPEKNVIYTNRSFACIYSYEGGEVTLRRKEDAVLTEWYTEEKITVGRSGTAVQFKPKETKMYLVEENKIYEEK